MKKLYSILGLIFMLSAGLSAQTLDYNNLQFPGSGTIDPVGSLTVYAQAYEAGVTEAAGVGSGVECWIGVNTADTDPSTWGEASFTIAPYFGQGGPPGFNNDEFSLAIGNGLVPGTYYYASRFRLSGGPFTYGGTTGSGGGTWDGTTNVSGVLTVNDPQLDFNNLQFPSAITVDYGTSGDVYAQAYEAGVTEAAGVGSGVECWIGVNSADTDPSSWAESAFISAPFISQEFNNDQFLQSIGADLAPGTYYYASRFQYNGGNYSYGGFSGSNGGTWDGSTNVSGVLTVSSVPAIYINEVDADDAGTDDLGFVELFGPANEPLDGYVLVLFNGSDDQSYNSSFDLDGESLDANGFYVIGNSGVANVDSVVSGDWIQNGADAVALFVGDAADFPNDTPISTSGIIDAMVYDTNDGDDAALLALINSGQPQLNEDGNGQKDTESNSRLPDGGVRLDTDTYVQQAPTPGVTNVIPTCTIDSIVFVSSTACDPLDNTYSATVLVYYTNAPGTGTLDVNGQNETISTSPQTVTFIDLASDGLGVDVSAEFSADTGCNLTENALYTAPSNCFVNTITINEIDYDQDGTDGEEFIELYNSGASLVSLDNYTLELINGSSTSVYETITFSGASILAGGYYVICIGSNANLYCDQTESGSIQNGAPDAIALNHSGSQVDAVSYEGDVTGYVEGTGITSGDVDEDNRSLIRFPDGTDTDDNDADFTLACISPGAMNVVCPSNDDCAEAFEVDLSLFGVSSWDTVNVANASESLMGCVGDADDDVWFKFTAGDFNDYIIAHDPNGLTDLVVQLFDGCAGTSLGCYNNYPAGAVERALPGGLAAGTEYFYRVYDEATGIPLSTEIRTQVKTWADGGIRQKYCDSLDYSLEHYITPERQDLNELYPLTSLVVKGYGVRLIDPIVMDTLTKFKTGYGAQYFQLSEFGPEFNTLYDASAKHRLKVDANGSKTFYWSDWGPSCSIGIADVDQTRIRNQFCGNAIGYQMDQLIQAEYVQNATAYRYTFDDGVNQYTETNTSYGVFLYEIAELEFGVSYTVTVEARVAGVWASPGDPCTINMAAGPESTQLKAAYCNGTYEYPASNYILAEQVYGSDAYEWRFDPVGGGDILTQITSGISLAFHITTMELETGVTYNVSVRAKAGGIWGVFGPSCQVTMQEPSNSIVENNDALEVKVVSDKSHLFSLYPNPNSGEEFMIGYQDLGMDQTRLNIQIVDMLGQEVQSVSVSVKGENGIVRIQTDEALKTGLYLIRISGKDLSTSIEFMVN